MTQADRRLYLIRSLIQERTEYGGLQIPRDAAGQRQLLRGLMNVRAPMAASEEFLAVQDDYLRQELAEAGVTDADDLRPISGGLYLWQGDITRLRCGAIVNAANSGMTGCYIPCHACIDNCIHTNAGVQLRLDCARLMAEQGHEEPAGKAKITRAYDLPCDYVIHTVGPIVEGRVTRADRRLLASCYRSCLELAEQNAMKSIAFCCISTGVFHFPNEQAAEIAVETVWQYQIRTERSMRDYSAKLEQLRTALRDADAVVVGAGSGLSTAAGFTYSGERFDRYFSDFAAKYGFRDMYSGGFYPFPDKEEFWAYWSRYILINRYQDAPQPVYDALLALLAGKDYFVITTNVDHCFQKAGFDKKRLFYTQGDYGLFQCSLPRCQETFDNETVIRQMVERQENMRVPTELLPRCPHCGRPLTMNLRCDDTFVQDEGWYAAAERYENFLRTREGQKILFLELGVGYNTPVIIKYPFWQMTAKNPQATYACVNQGGAVTMRGLEERSILIDADIGRALEQLKR